MSAPKQGAELLIELEEITSEEVKNQFAKHGLFDAAQRNKIAAGIGRSVADFVSLSWGGQQVYLPKDNKRRAAIIYDEFDGNNIPELARKYSLCVQTVYKIIRKERQARSMRQGSLLD